MATDRTSPPGPGRSRRLRVGVSLLAVGGLVFVVLTKRSSLARSFVRVGHPRWSWVAVAVVLESLSMVTFALMQGRLLRVGGKRVGARPMIATILAANSLSGSVPFAGPEMGAALTFRRFREQGADSTLASWTLVVGGLVSWFGAFVVLAAGGALSGDVKLAGVAVLIGLLGGAVGLVLVMSLRRRRVQNSLDRAASWVVRLVARLRSKPTPDPVAVVSAWMTSLHSLRPSRGEWNKIGALGLGNWFADIGVLAVSIVALGGPVPWRSLLLVYALATVVGSLGLTPGGLGLVEGTLCVGLVSAGLPAALALPAVLLYRLVSFWSVLFAGWLVLLRLRLGRMPPRQLALAENMAR